MLRPNSSSTTATRRLHGQRMGDKLECALVYLRHPWISSDHVCPNRPRWSRWARTCSDLAACKTKSGYILIFIYSMHVLLHRKHVYIYIYTAYRCISEFFTRSICKPFVGIPFPLAWAGLASCCTQGSEETKRTGFHVFAPNIPRYVLHSKISWCMRSSRRRGWNQIWIQRMQESGKSNRIRLYNSNNRTNDCFLLDSWEH